MKVLVLNGSPRKDGTVTHLLQDVISGIKQPIEVEWINIYSLEMKPCLGCMRCRSLGSCILPEDDAHRVGRLIADADGLIIGTPTHWGNMSCQLKLLLDRNVPVFMGEKLNGLPLPKQKGKPAVIVTACTTPYPFNFIFRESRGAISAVREVLHYGGYRLIGSAVKPGSKRTPIISNHLKNKAFRLGQRFSKSLPS
ncbi:MAG: flavodoxin family protein [Methylocystaceae bacterium]